MVLFVTEIADYARNTLGKADLLVVPQNGAGLVGCASYLSVISGQAAEDTWYDGDEVQDPEHTSEVLPLLDKVTAAGKFVLAVDYATRESLIDDFYCKVSGRGYTPYCTVRDLDKLTINPGHEP
jgi:uncharacterized protein (TIGR01370 family)